MWIKEDSQWGPKWPNIGKTAAQNEAPKHAQNASFEKQMDREDQWPPRAGCGDHHGPWWDARLCAQPRTAVRPLASAAVPFFFCDSSFSSQFVAIFAL